MDLEITNADNGANVGVPDSLIYLDNANAAETMADGMVIEQSGAGTMTNALRIVESAGTIANGIVLSGTYTVGMDAGNNVITNIGNANTDFTSGGGLNLAGALDVEGQVDLGDGGDSIVLNGTTLTMSATGAGNDVTINLVDSNTDAFDIQEGTNNYLNIDTTNGSERVTIGNSTVAASSITLDIGGSGNFVLSDFTSCTALETNGSGVLVCGADDGGSLQSAYVGGNTLDITSGEGALDIDLQSANMDIEVGEGTDTGNFRIWDGASNWLFIDEASDTMAVGGAAGGGLTLDAGNGNINLGTSANPRTINIGTGTGIDTINMGTDATAADIISIGNTSAGAVTLSGGTNSLIDFPNFDVSTAGTVTVAAGQSYTGSGALTLSSGAGTGLTINSGTTGAIALGDDASAETITLGTGGAVKTVTLGSTNTTSATTVQSGTGDLTFSSTDEIIFNMVDNNPDALDIQQGTDNYINIDTTNNSESITLGTSVGNLGITLDVNGTGVINLPDYTTCTALETDGSGNLTCGTDEGGSLQGAYEGGNTIDITAAEGALDFDLQSANFDIEVGQGTDTGNFRIWDGGTNWFYIDEGSDTMAIGAAAGGGLTLDTGGGGIDIGSSNNVRTINIGTGTAVDTINIGTGATGADIIRLGVPTQGR